jgi:hypothetical protein
MKGRKLNDAMKKQTNIQTYKQTNSQTTIRYAPHPSFFCFVSLKYSKRNWVGGKKERKAFSKEDMSIPTDQLVLGSKAEERY